jgi:uncharacterized protein
VQPTPDISCSRLLKTTATLLDLGDLEDELKSLLGVEVDLLTPGDLPPKFRAKVLAEAKPV